MNFEFDDNKPIYKQLVDEMTKAIITEKYKSKERLPSVRELSMITKVNPNTIQRALTQLESEGLIVTKRTSGKFVTDDYDKIIAVKKEIANDTLNKFVLQLEELNISTDEIIEFIRKKGKDN